MQHVLFVSGKRIQEIICVSASIVLLLFNFYHLYINFQMKNWYIVLTFARECFQISYVNEQYLERNQKRIQTAKNSFIYKSACLINSISVRSGNFRARGLFESGHQFCPLNGKKVGKCSISVYRKCISWYLCCVSFTSFPLI